MSPWSGPARSRVPALAEAAVERARLTLVPRRTRARRVPFVILVSLLLLTGVIGLLVFNTQMQQASFAATTMEQRAAELRAREQRLQMELDRLRDPQRVAQEARALGMVPVPSPAFLRLSDGTVVGDATPAGAADAIRLTPLPPRKPPSLRGKVVVRPRPADDEAAVNAARSGAGWSGGPARLRPGTADRG